MALVARRGFGDTIPTVMDVPGMDTILSNLPLVGPYTVGSSAPTSAANQAALSLALTPPPVSSGSISDFINQNGTTLALVGGGLLFVMLMGGGGRRRR